MTAATRAAVSLSADTLSPTVREARLGMGGHWEK